MTDNATLNLTLLAILCLVLVAVVGALLTWLSKPKADTAENQTNRMIERVNAELPQTQCAQCGYPGCRPYAAAIIENNEAINRCPPGGDRTIVQLAQLLGTKVLPLDDQCGDTKPAQVAIIDEAVCIGCTLCIHACPVDAIVGAAKLMHTVISDDCTGCELCIPPCPVDCIDLVNPPQTVASWQWPKPAL